MVKLSVFLVFSGVIVGLIRRFFYIVTIQGPSMMPTFLHGERVLVLRYWPSGWLRKGQIIVGDIDYTVGEQTQHERVIKRITGLPGETLSFTTPKPTDQPPHSNVEQMSWFVPDQHMFLQGDGASIDSRIWGPVPMAGLFGIVVAKLPTKQDVSVTNATSNKL